VKPALSMSAPLAEFTELCDFLVEKAKGLLVKNGGHSPLGFIFHGTKMSIYELPMDSYEAKRKTQADFRKRIQKLHGYQAVVISEVWTKSQKWFDHIPETSLESDPEAGEALQILIVNPENYVNINVPFYSGSEGQFVFDDPIHHTKSIYDQWFDGVKLSSSKYQLYIKCVQLAKEHRLSRKKAL
jgi:hypothetical protein